MPATGAADPRTRNAIRAGMVVEIVKKEDQRSGKRTRGTVSASLTNSGFHPHGSKVRLTSGAVGRVVEIMQGVNGSTNRQPGTK